MRSFFRYLPFISSMTAYIKDEIILQEKLFSEGPALMKRILFR